MTFSDLLDQLKKEYNNYAIKITSAEMGSDIISKLCIERNRHRMTREQMSKLTGIKVSRIRKIETVQVIPTLNEIVKMATVLGMKLVLADVYGKETSNG